MIEIPISSEHFLARESDKTIVAQKRVFFFLVALACVNANNWFNIPVTILLIVSKYIIARKRKKHGLFASEVRYFIKYNFKLRYFALT